MALESIWATCTFVYSGFKQKILPCCSMFYPSWAKFSVTSVWAVFIEAPVLSCNLGVCVWVESTLNSRSLQKNVKIVCCGIICPFKGSNRCIWKGRWNRSLGWNTCCRRPFWTNIWKPLGHYTKNWERLAKMKMQLNNCCHVTMYTGKRQIETRPSRCGGVSFERRE